MARAKKDPQDPQNSAPSLVKMQRDGQVADVHPIEVEHMQAHGWAKVV